MYSTLAVHTEQMRVVGAVKQGVERDAVGRQETNIFSVRPGYDVGRFDEHRQTQSGNGAPTDVAREHHVSEEILVHAFLPKDEPLFTDNTGRRVRGNVGAVRFEEEVDVDVLCAGNLDRVFQERFEREFAALAADVVFPYELIDFRAVGET